MNAARWVEFTGPYIPLAECRHGWTYRIRSRNLAFGVFNSKMSGFVGIREKFGSMFLFTEYHWDTGAPYGTVKPETAVEECPITDLRESIGDFCSVCGTEVEYIKDPVNPRASHWSHKADRDCPGGHAYARMNQPLFDYLEALESREGNPPIRDPRGGVGP